MKVLPTFSVIIPKHKRNSCKRAIEYLKKTDYPEQKIEIIVVEGSLPSVQRNEAIKKAQGDILLFLDNDSLVSTTIFEEILNGIQFIKKRNHRNNSNWIINFSLFILSHIFTDIGNITERKKEIVAVGGPNLNLGVFENIWEIISSDILESTFAHWKMAARFTQIGNIRMTEERELILCNLAVKRSIFVHELKFNDLLYPGEDGELIRRILNNEKYGIVYNPNMTIQRKRRKILLNIIQQFFNYGKARTEQIRLSGLEGNLFFLAPLLLVFYLIMLPYLIKIWNYLILTPLFIYLFFAFLSSFGSAKKYKDNIFIFILPFFYFLSHIVYAVGILLGLFTNFNKRQQKIEKLKKKIKIKKIKKFEDCYETI